MSKQKHNQKVQKEFKGLNGTQIKYLKDSIKWGHLESNTKRRSNARSR